MQNAKYNNSINAIFKTPVNVDISGLSNPMTSILGLSVHCWIPIAVIEDHCVSPSQIDPNPTRSGAQNEGKVLAVIVESKKGPGSFDEQCCVTLYRVQTAKFAKEKVV